MSPKTRKPISIFAPKSKVCGKHKLSVPVAPSVKHCVSSAKGCGFNPREHTY